MDIPIGALGSQLERFAREHRLPLRAAPTVPFYERFRNHAALGSWGRIPCGTRKDGTEILLAPEQVQPLMLRGGDGRLRLDYLAYQHVLPNPIELVQLRSADRSVFYRSSPLCGIDHLVIDDLTGNPDAHAAIARLGIRERPERFDWRALALAELAQPQRGELAEAAGIAPYTPSPYFLVATTMRELARGTPDEAQLHGHLYDGPSDRLEGPVLANEYPQFFDWASSFLRLRAAGADTPK